MSNERTELSKDSIWNRPMPRRAVVRGAAITAAAVGLAAIDGPKLWTPATANAQVSLTCQPWHDGVRVYAHEATVDAQGGISYLTRKQVSFNEGVGVVEYSLANEPGKPEGFRGLRRGILVTPRTGPVWDVHLKGRLEGFNLYSASGVRYCGDKDREVVPFALQHHVPSLEQASTAEDGQQPSRAEIPFDVLTYEGGLARRYKEGFISREEVVQIAEITFHEGLIYSEQPITFVN